MISVPMTPATPGNEPAGYYGTLADVYAKAGETNANIYSNLEADDRDLDPARMQTAMSQSESEINVYLDTNGCESPAPTGAPAFSLLQQAWALLTVANLYDPRGERDMNVTDATGVTRAVNTKSKQWRSTAWNLAARYVMSQRRDISTSVALTGTNRLGYFPCG